MTAPKIAQPIIDLYDEYTHAPLERRVFLRRLADLAGGAAAAAAILPLIEVRAAAAAMIAADDGRLETGYVTYAGETGAVRSYWAKPKPAADKLGTVIVIHENRGLNAHIEDVARRAALAGFFAIAPDLLSIHGGTPPDTDQARALNSRLTPDEAVAELKTVVRHAKERPDTTDKIGCVGFCWGGGMADRLAGAASDLAACVSFYGAPPPPELAKKIKAKLLLHYAGLDNFVNPHVPAFEAALKAAGVDYTKYVYDGVNHAFHNDTAPGRYDEAAAKLAWQRSVAFFKANLAG
jgi:carboxymethylenebutenolidase